MNTSNQLKERSFKRFAGVITISIIAIIAGFIASPYWRLYSLASAINNANELALAKQVDWSNVRTSVKSSLETQIAAQFEKQEKSSLLRIDKANNSTQLKAAIAPAVIDKIVEFGCIYDLISVWLISI